MYVSLLEVMFLIQDRRSKIALNTTMESPDMATRRQFLTVTAGALAAYAAGLKAEIGPARKPLEILFLGGTGFLGPHQINHALARGHKVTMFNRGRSSGMYGDAVEELVGNRDDRVDDGLNALRGDRRWDVVIDNSGYVPRHVKDSVELLKNRCDRYVYVSTVAVYELSKGGTFSESSKLAELDDPSVEEVNGETYGPLKAACDLIVQEQLGDRATIVRPTFVVGPGDHTDRFTYWVVRVNRGGEILAPGGPELTTQWVDARDLCPWIVTLAENGTPGIFNAAGSDYTRDGLMWGLRALTDQDVEFVWPSFDLLEEMEFNTPMMYREMNVKFENSASKNAGLHYRSLADSANDTLEWWQAQSEERRSNPRSWESPDREKEVIARVKRSTT